MITVLVLILVLGLIAACYTAAIAASTLEEANRDLETSRNQLSRLGEENRTLVSQRDKLWTERESVIYARDQADNEVRRLSRLLEEEKRLLNAERQEVARLSREVELYAGQAEQDAARASRMAGVLLHIRELTEMREGGTS